MACSVDRNFQMVDIRLSDIPALLGPSNLGHWSDILRGFLELLNAEEHIDKQFPSCFSKIRADEDVDDELKTGEDLNKIVEKLKELSHVNWSKSGAAGAYCPPWRNKASDYQRYESEIGQWKFEDRRVRLLIKASIANVRSQLVAVGWQPEKESAYYHYNFIMREVPKMEQINIQDTDQAPNEDRNDTSTTLVPKLERAKVQTIHKVDEVNDESSCGASTTMTPQTEEASVHDTDGMGYIGVAQADDKSTMTNFNAREIVDLMIDLRPSDFTTLAGYYLQLGTLRQQLKCVKMDSFEKMEIWIAMHRLMDGYRPDELRAKILSEIGDLESLMEGMSIQAKVEEEKRQQAKHVRAQQIQERISGLQRKMDLATPSGTVSTPSTAADVEPRRFHYRPDPSSHRRSISQ